MASPIAAMRQRKASLALRVDFESEFPETVVFHHAHRISVAITQRNGCTNPDRDPPNELLEHRELTEIVSPEISIAVEHFQTKGQAARYISAVLNKLNSEELAVDAGLWTWMTLVFFDSVCPSLNCKRSVKMTTTTSSNRRICGTSTATCCLSHGSKLRLAPRHNRLILTTRLDSLDGVTTEVMKRLYLTRIPSIFEVLDRLYWDESRKRPRSGITGNKPQAGNLRHRLPVRIAQLEITCDLMSLAPDQLLELLGDEFSFARQHTATLFDDVVD